MATLDLDINDFTCSICKEIFDHPVNLNCSHSFCESCLTHMRRSASPSSESSETHEESLPRRPPAPSHSTIVYAPKVYQPDQSFTCAMCRDVSQGYTECRDLTLDMESLDAPCSNCGTLMKLNELRKHSETCFLPKKEITSDVLHGILKKRVHFLSDAQTEALEKAKSDDNRSTFRCPFCQAANFTPVHLRHHIKEQHRDEDQRKVCPICAAMPWGDKSFVSRNLYGHLKDRHRFDYDTYVSYEEDEEEMLAQAIQRSLSEN